MGLQGDQHTSPGDLMREVRQLRREVRALQSAQPLRSASIDSGGLSVKDGFIRWLDAEGNETARFATDGLTLQGLLSVAGDIVVDGGSIEVVNSSGATVFKADADGVTMSGDLLVGGDTTLTGTLDVQGSIDVASSGTVESSNFAAGSSGYRLLGTGDAEFNTITLRDGIVGDDALAALSRTKVAQADDERSTSIGSSESLGLSIPVPSWATTITASAAGTIHLAGVADSVSCEFFCTIEGNEGPHNAFHVDRASNTGTVHHLRAMTPGNISGNLNVSVTADPINNPADVFGIKLFISLTAVFER